MRRGDVLYVTLQSDRIPPMTGIPPLGQWSIRRVDDEKFLVAEIVTVGRPPLDKVVEADSLDVAFRHIHDRMEGLV